MLNNSMAYELEAENFVDLAIRINSARKLSDQDADLQLYRDLAKRVTKWNNMMEITYQVKRK